MKRVISVLTCPSLRPQYLQATLEGLDDNGAIGYERWVCCDGELPAETMNVIPMGWQIKIKSDGPSGTRRAMWWVYREAYLAGVDQLLYCEDDLIVGCDAVTRAFGVELGHDIALANFFDSREFHPGRYAPGFHKIPVHGLDGHGLWGSLMCLIPRRTFGYLLSRSPVPARPGEPGGWLDPWPEKPNAADCTMSWALQMFSPWRWRLQHVPSLVDHAGDVSALRTARIRRAAWFVGREPGPPPAEVLCRTCLVTWPCGAVGAEGHESF